MQISNWRGNNFFLTLTYLFLNFFSIQSSESSSESSDGEESADEDSSCPPGVNFSQIRADSVPVEVNTSTSG